MRHLPAALLLATGALGVAFTTGVVRPAEGPTLLAAYGTAGPAAAIADINWMSWDQAVKATDRVTVHYTGKNLDGSVFDSSVQRGEPTTFPLNGVIAGWTEGVQLMTPGAKYRFYIPSDLAYGERGAGADIAPGATLMFDVELISVN